MPVKNSWLVNLLRAVSSLKSTIHSSSDMTAPSEPPKTAIAPFWPMIGHQEKAARRGADFMISSSHLFN